MKREKDPKRKLERRRRREAAARSKTRPGEAVARAKRETPDVRGRSRCIPSSVRERVLERAGYQCEYRGVSGVRCTARTRLDVDHIRPLEKGGGCGEENLRILCRGHNLLAAEREFGEEFMRGKIAVRKAERRRGGGVKESAAGVETAVPGRSFLRSASRVVTFGLLAVLAVLAGCGAVPESDPDLRPDPDPYDSGGPLLPEQAAYDVTRYDLAVEVFPDRKAIRGTLSATARVGSPLSWFVLDLDPLLEVTSVEAADGGGELDYERRGGRLWIALGTTRQPGETVAVTVAYEGTPREAVRPPWDGGFTWARTPSGEPWIATTCQGEGADVWWPVKDHVSDEPDSMDIDITVPAPLVAASNGRRTRIEDHGDGRRTYHWHVSTPINAYNVALNIAPYETIEGEYTSVAGETFTVTFWVLPEDVERGRELFDEILAHLRFYEETVGPYPFRADKYGVAQTPHLGMEHQTIIAYGAGFDNGAMTGHVDWGFDALHHHELSHEWWGNLVTNADWNDMWLHEGFGTYMQCLYIERTQGSERYRDYLRSLLRRISNAAPLASRESLPTSAVPGGDIYFKGAWVLHTLRFLIGDEAFRTVLRRMAYPTPELEKFTDGRQCRFATTDELVSLVERISGRDLGWFFEVYARQPELPRLHTKRLDNRLELRWEVPHGLSFPMPVEVRLAESTRRVDVPAGGAVIDLPTGIDPAIDPDAWILRESLLER